MLGPDAPPARDGHAPLIALVAGGVAYLAFLVVAPGPRATVTALNDIGQMLVPLGIAVPLLVAAGRRSAGRQRASWYLLAGAALSWGLGQAVWTWFEVVLEQTVPYPGLADVGYLGAIPFLLAGVLIFPSRSLRSIGRARALLDGLLAIATVLFASYGTFRPRESYRHTVALCERCESRIEPLISLQWWCAMDELKRKKRLT